MLKPMNPPCNALRGANDVTCIEEAPVCWDCKGYDVGRRTRMALAMHALPLWRSRSTYTEWMGTPSPQRKTYPIAKGKG